MGRGPPYTGGHGVRAAIAVAARELNELRERWFNPPEWTRGEVLEFPGSVGGPWGRYVHGANGQGIGRSIASCDRGTRPSVGIGRSIASCDRGTRPSVGIGLVRYPRLVPKDAECAAKLKKRTLTNLYNQRPAWLDLAHRRLDEAVSPPTAGPPTSPTTKFWNGSWR